MAEKQATILNEFPRERFNVLIPVQSLQALSSLQKPVVNKVELDVRLDQAGKPVGKDIYMEQNGEWAITKVGGMKLAAAANISIVESKQIHPEACNRCMEMAKYSGIAPACGNCESRYNVAFSVSIRVPELSGGFRVVSGTREIDCVLEKAHMTDNQYKRFLPHRAAMAESKAFMRALRNALGLQGTYTYNDIKKPFVVAHIVPDLDNPLIQHAAAQSMLQSMGMLFEVPDAASPAALPASIQEDALSQAQLPPALDQGQETGQANPAESIPEFLLETGVPICSGCSSMIQPSGNWTPEAIGKYSIQRFGRPLCPACQKDAIILAKGGTTA